MPSVLLWRRRSSRLSLDRVALTALLAFEYLISFRQPCSIRTCMSPVSNLARGESEAVNIGTSRLQCNAWSVALHQAKRTTKVSDDIRYNSPNQFI